MLFLGILLNVRISYAALSGVWRRVTEVKSIQKVSIPDGIVLNPPLYEFGSMLAAKISGFVPIKQQKNTNNKKPRIEKKTRWWCKNVRLSSGKKKIQGYLE